MFGSGRDSNRSDEEAPKAVASLMREGRFIKIYKIEQDLQDGLEIDEFR
jgi:hypothetical protein